MRPFAEWLSGRMADRRIGVRTVAIGMKAKGFETSRSMISQYKRDEVVPPMEKAEAFARFFDDDEDAVRELIKRSRAQPPDDEGVEEVVTPAIPAGLTREFAREVADELLQLLASGERLPVASAGPGAPGDLDVVRPHIMRIRGEVGLQRGPLVAFEVVGDCLEPRLRPGWIAWVNPEATRRPGDIVLAYVDGEEMFKQFDRDRDTGAEFLTALNGRPPIPVGPNVRIEGVVQLVQHAP